MESGLERYANFIRLMIGTPAPFIATVEDATTIQVERGLAGPVVDLPIDRDISVVDAGGHARPMYRPLLVYSWLLNHDVKSSRAVIDPWIDSLDPGIWQALVLAVAGELFDQQSWRDSARQSFTNLLDRQQPGGAFLPVDSKANPETRWYEELMLLHALASYSVRVDDARMNAAVRNSALFHLEETQPDHASAQPWGLPAFVRYAPPLADQVLHALSMQYPAGVSGVPLLLLTDALYGLRRLTAK